MSYLSFLYLYLATIPVFFGIDMLWLGLIAKNFYKKHLGYLMADQVQWSSAIIFYLLYIFGILFFAVLPALKLGDSGGLKTALLYGALLGLLCYATYDLTNHATIKNWPSIVVWLDLFWGICLTASVSVISFYIAKWIL